MSALERWRDQFPLRARGRHIVNRRGERFKFVGVNWYGGSDAYGVVGGLAERPLEDICKDVAAMGFTVVRLPFSNEMLRATSVPAGAIDYDSNPALRGRTPLEVFDRTVDALGDAGVAVVVNNHTTFGTWSGGPDGNGLWYVEGSDIYTEDSWVGDWLVVACRYAKRPHVVGYDLRNEVRPTTMVAAVSQGPGWSTGEEGTDWSTAAGNCTRALMALEGVAEGLIIVERLAWPQESLETMLSPRPPWELWGVPRDRLVLSLHMYAWSGPGAWSPKAFTGHLANAFFHIADFVRAQSLYGELDEAALAAQLDAEFGFCLDRDICPVWVSEFGADLTLEHERRWFQATCRYLERKSVDFAYWPLNVGLKPASTEDEGYGFLTADWRPRWCDQRLRALRRMLPSGQALFGGPPPALCAPSTGSRGGDVAFCAALSPAPWCAPLPGPLVPWPADGSPGLGVDLAEALPPPRYLWYTLPGVDADPGQNADVSFGSLEDMQRRCLASGHGGFALYAGVAHMRSASGDQLKRRIVSGYQQTTMYLAEEIRLCAVWAEFDDDLDDAGGEGAAAQGCKEMDLTGLVEKEGRTSPSLLDDACRAACLREGFVGFETSGARPGWGRLLSREAGEAALARCAEREADSPAQQVLARRWHVLQPALVRVELEALESQDAYGGCNARVCRGATLAQCKQVCLEEGFGGFVVFDGTAYFRSATAAVLRRRLVRSPGSTLFLLSCEELQSQSGAQQGASLAVSRRRLLETLLPKLSRADA